MHIARLNSSRFTQIFVENPESRPHASLTKRGI